MSVLMMAPNPAVVLAHAADRQGLRSLTAALHRWMKIADQEDGVRFGAVSDDAAKLREANKRIRLLEQEAEVVRRAPCGGLSLAGHQSKKMMYPLVRELPARDAPIRVPVAVSCPVLNFSTQAYYQWAANPVPDRDWDEAHTDQGRRRSPPGRSFFRTSVHRR